jgi:hypothetical protein
MFPVADDALRPVIGSGAVVDAPGAKSGMGMGIIPILGVE